MRVLFRNRPWSGESADIRRMHVVDSTVLANENNGIRETRCDPTTALLDLQCGHNALFASTANPRFFNSFMRCSFHS